MPKWICNILWGCSCASLLDHLYEICCYYKTHPIINPGGPLILLLDNEQEMAKLLLQTMLDEHNDYEEYILYLAAHEGCSFAQKTRFKNENPLGLIRLMEPIITAMLQNAHIQTSVKIAPVTFSANNSNGRNLVGHRHEFIVITHQQAQSEKLLIGNSA
ncbi:MAG: hypothetical protein M1338_00815 [Patescibacteria group bacterium]|nr:hypothetical protein [Patescibacteria group bacterium]